MHGLLEFANRKEVREIVKLAIEKPAVQGVVAEYHPLWLMCRQLDSQEWGFFWQMYHYARYPMGPMSFFPQWHHRMAIGQPDHIVRDRWQRVGNGDPYQLRICMKPTDDDKHTKFPEFPDLGINLVFETRPLARLTSDSGLIASVGKRRGTIGGTLKSTHGDWLGVTCSHVVKDDPTVDIEEEGSILSRILAVFNKTPNVSGECVSRTNLIELTSSTPCNPDGETDPSNTLDIAFIKADFDDLDVVKQSQPPARRASASSGQAVTMLATDGRRTAELGGIGIYYILNKDGKSYCFSGLFEVLAPPYTSKIVHDRDSGAWIMRHGPSGDEWFGMVLGSDDLRGFAMFAEPIYGWAESEGLV